MASRTYTPEEQAELLEKYPGTYFAPDGRAYTEIEVPESEIVGYDQEGRPLDYLGNPVTMKKELQEANFTDSFPYWALGLMLGGPAAVEGLGALGGLGAGSGAGSGTAAAGSTAAAGTGAGAVTGSLPAGLSFGVGAPAAGSTAAAGAGVGAGVAGGGAAAAGGSMLGKVGKFLNSPLGQVATQAGLKGLEGALSPDPVTPFQFSQVGGEKGRLVSPENALYNLQRMIMGLGLGVGRKLEGGTSLQTKLPGQTPSIDIPGLPFKLGGVGSSMTIPKQPGFNFNANGQNQLTGLLEGLLAPPPPPDLTPQGMGGTPSGATARPTPARRREPK